MQTDIQPPRRRPNTKKADHQKLRGSQLRKRSLDRSRDRLTTKRLEEKPPPIEEQIISELPLHLLEPPARHRLWHTWSKRQKIDAVCLAVVLTIALGFGGYLVFHKKPQPPPAFVVRAAVKPTTVPSPLTGVKVDPRLAKRPVTAIMIENSLDARPQSGLQEAGVVFEAIAEGGITRFMALFQEAQPQYVGPVRSLRPYYIDFAGSFDASVAHVGGSPKALSQIRHGGKDLDQFFNAGSYWRQPTRLAPHNVYTSFKKLDTLNKSKGYKKSHFTSWQRKIDRKLIKPTAVNIDFNLSGYYYNVHYTYDAKTNSYYRREGGLKHFATDSPNDRKPDWLHPKVVIALVMPYRVVDSSGHSDYGTTGHGTMYIFQDGGLTTGIWKKASRDTNFSFVTKGGTPIKLDAGQSWVTIVRSSGEISHSSK